MTSLVGLDIGTTGVKALALSPDGAVTGRAEEKYPLSMPRPGWAEQDPDDWVRAAEAALGRLGGDRSLGLSGQMHGLVVLDSEQRVLRPAILWNDQRTAAECAEIEERIGLGRLIELTGNRALPGFTAPKLLWLRRHEPEVYARIEHVLLPKDYVRLRLTGERATDAADASGTLLFDVSRRRWSEEVLEALELPDAWLPLAYESPDVPAAPGAGDQAAAALGVGVDGPGPLSVVLGTSGVVFAALPGFAADPQARVHAFCHAVPGGWHAMGVMLSAAGSLRWLRDAVGGTYGELIAEAERWPPGVEADVGRASGGGARSDLWLRIAATVLDLPLERPVVEEGSAYGAALLAGVAAGSFADVHEAVEACVRTTGRIEPEPLWRDAHEAGYARFRALYPALRPLEDR